MRMAGLDGFSRGWVAVISGAGEPRLHFIADVSELVALDVTRAAIDMPIGLPDFSGDHPRACDLAARQQLKPHASRVFTGARRGLWDHQSPAAANRALKAAGRMGISLQLWHLGRKIVEVDQFVRSGPAIDIREAHPELVFRRLNTDQPVPSKKTVEGVALRKALLVEQGFSADLLDQWLLRDRIGSGAKIDDVLDACACAIAARDFDRGHCLPAGDPPRDALGVPMQIWF